ncbi:outer membrane beta-barrel protein [Duganella sp. LjRoot269]|jgi:opacity protein-like surface antigen|uniref:outer membrane beta-barrel protein n=1 Tax=Duganella sp. LjRoot269 TaxID=3342305 RepID=UPI003ED090D9
MSPIFKSLCGALIGVALAAGSCAGAEELSPYYVGADLGIHTKYKLECWNGIGCDDIAGRSGRLYGGYTFGSNVVFGKDNSNSVELSTFEFGNVRSVVQSSPDGGHLPAKSKVYGLALDYASRLKLSDRLSLVSRAGLSMARSSVQYADAFTLNNYGAAGSVRHNRFGLTYGLGLSYAVDKNWSVNVDWRRTPVKLGANDKTHVDMVSFGVGYNF